jgi:DNA repair protein RadC
MQTQTMKLRELTIRYSVKKDGDGQAVIVGRSITSPRDSAAALVALLQDEPTEVFAILCLTTKYRVIAYHEVIRGTLDSTLVHPRLCSVQHNRGYVAAVLMWGSGCICCTPSAPRPSQHNIRMLSKVVNVASVLS